MGSFGDRRQADISFIRLVALIFIIICHIQQYLDIELCWWFNVGVQMFLTISGYLYGQKNIDDVSLFYAKRAGRIVVPYIITTAAFGLLQCFFARQHINLSILIKSFLLKGRLDGGEHLWFVPTILMCYLITPLFNLYKKKIHRAKDFWIVMIGSVVLTSYSFGMFINYFNAAWMSCYVVGYMLGVNEEQGYVSIKHILLMIAPMAVLCNGFQIYLEYGLKINSRLFDYFCDYSHVLLGILLVLVIRLSCKSKDLKKFLYSDAIEKILGLADRYSYDVYLVHQFFILGPLSLMTLTENIAANIVIISGSMFISAYILNKAESHVFSIIAKA